MAFSNSLLPQIVGSKCLNTEPGSCEDNKTLSEFSHETQEPPSSGRSKSELRSVDAAVTLQAQPRAALSNSLHVGEEDLECGSQCLNAVTFCNQHEGFVIDEHLEDPACIRGTPLREVLVKCGAALTADAADFTRSRPVADLDLFICHTWDTDRSSQFAALALHSNFWKSLAVWAFLVIILVLLDIFDQLPTFTRQRGDKLVAMSPWCSVLSFPCYWIVLCFYNELPCCQGPTVFIDKLCVDQNDETQRKLGIKAIPSIIERSRAMLVVLTPSGLTKVWTMFELTSFLILHGPRYLYVQPAFLSKVCLLGSLVVYCCVLNLLAINSITEEELHIWCLVSLLLVTLPPSIAFAIYLLRWGNVIKELHNQASQFDFNTASCTVEADRIMLKKMIARMFYRDMVEHFDVADSRNFSQEEVLSYQKELRILVADAVLNSLGRTGLPLRFLISMTVSGIALELDSVSADLRYARLNRSSSAEVLLSALRAVLDVSFYLAWLSLICYLCVCEIHKPHTDRWNWLIRAKVSIIFVVSSVLFAIPAIYSQYTANLLLLDHGASVPVAITAIGLCFINLLILVFFNGMSCQTQCIHSKLNIDSAAQDEHSI